MESERVVKKLKELYPFLVEEKVGVTAIPRDNEWLVFFGKGGHEEAFTLPGDFITSCVEKGICGLYREECTQALGRLMESIRARKASAAQVVSKLKWVVPELDDPGIIIAVSEDEPFWSFFMTRKGSRRPVEFKLPSEIIDACIGERDCTELKKAATTAYQCLIGQ
jgi:hypothetical protein